MADLFSNKLLHSSSLKSSYSHPFSFPFSLSPHSNCSIIRFVSLRRNRLSHSSSVLANLSTRLDIISTAEQSDGSVVFRFGHASEISQSFENDNASDANSKLLVEDEHDINHTKSEFVETSIEVHNEKYERESGSDAKVHYVDENESNEVGSSVDSKEDEIHSFAVEDSKASKVLHKTDGTQVHDFIDSKLQLDRCFVSTGKKENVSNSETVMHDVETDSITISSGSRVDLVKHGVGVDTYVRTFDSSADSVVEKFEEACDGELFTAISNSQLELEGIELKDISDMSSCVETTEVVLSLKDSDLDGYARPEILKEYGAGDMHKIAEANSPVSVSVSDMAVCLEDNKLESNVKQAPIKEDDDSNKLQETADMDSLVDASNIAVSLKDDELDSNLTQVANGEDDARKLQEITYMDSLVGTSEAAVSLEHDELESHVKQVSIEENDNDKLLGMADMNPLVEASDTALSLEDSEVDCDAKQVVIEENDDEKLLEVTDMNQLLEASDTTLSLEVSEAESNVKQEVIQEEDGDKLLGNSDMSLLVEASDSELESNEKQAVIEEDNDDKLLGISVMNPLVESSDTMVSSEDSELESNVKHAMIEEDGDAKLQEITDMNSPIATSNMLVLLEDSKLDSNEKHLASKDDVSIEVMEKPVQLEAEPIFDEEARSSDNIAVLESTSESNMVDEASPTTIPLSDDDQFWGDVSEMASSEASGIVLAESVIDSLNSVEIAMPRLHLSSAAASLAHPLEALTGGKDAYFVCPNWFGVADGVDQWSFEGTYTGMYAHELMQNCEKLALNSLSAGLIDIKEVLQQSAATTKSTGSARVLIAHFANQALHVANIGDTGFVIIRNGAILKKSSPMFHEFNFPYAIGSWIDPLEVVEEYHIELEEDDVIVAATDGLFDNLYEKEIASIVLKSVAARMEPKKLAELLVTQAQEAGSSACGRSPFADTAQAAGHTGVVGGKLDHVTVVVSLVHNR